MPVFTRSRDLPDSSDDGTPASADAGETVPKPEAAECHPFRRLPEPTMLFVGELVTSNCHATQTRLPRVSAYGTMQSNTSSGVINSRLIYILQLRRGNRHRARVHHRAGDSTCGSSYQHCMDVAKTCI